MGTDWEDARHGPLANTMIAADIAIGAMVVVIAIYVVNKYGPPPPGTILDNIVWLLRIAAIGSVGALILSVYAKLSERLWSLHFSIILSILSFVLAMITVFLLIAG